MASGASNLQGELNDYNFDLGCCSLNVLQIVKFIKTD